MAAVSDFRGSHYASTHQKHGSGQGGRAALENLSPSVFARPEPTGDAEARVSVRAHRRDIDGLRAVAILGVLFYHLGLGRVTGGYGGVDVFFVISGFLIAGNIKSELDGGHFSISRFYVRRILRILPAGAAVAIATTIAAALIMFPNDIVEYGKSLIAFSTATSNYFFAHQTGYFDGAAIGKPLLHTWSLGVEEQFYAVFPIALLALAWLNARLILPMLVIVAAASLAYSVDQLAVSPQTTFFSTPARVWELLVGALLAYRAVPSVQTKLAAQFEGVTGLLLIGYGYFSYSDTTDFPGLAALPFCLGAALVIHAGESSQRNFASRALEVAPVVGIGLISYSLYLWHWPILVLTRYRFPEWWQGDVPINAGIGGALAMASIAVAWVSWQFVEQPFRSRDFPRSPFIVFPAGAAVISALVTAAFVAILRPQWFSSWPPNLAAIEKLEPQSCTLMPANEGWPGKNVCRLGKRGGPVDTLLWGDSHAGSLVPAFADYSAASGKDIIAATYGGCPPLAGVTLYGRNRDATCRGLTDALMRKALEPGVRRVVLAARWALYAEGLRGDDDGGTDVHLTPGPIAENAAVFAALLEATVKSLATQGREVVIIGPIPEQHFNVTSAVARTRAWNKALPPSLSHQDFERRQGHVLPVLDRLAKLRNVRVVYPDKYLCDATSCAGVVGDRSLYTDSNHLNGAGLQRLSPLFDAVFAVPPTQ